MTYSITKAILDIDITLQNLESPSADVRREAGAWAQYAFCGRPGSEKAAKLIEAVGKKLEMRVNGHAEPLEPDEYVRERCADTLRLAAEAGFNVSRFVPSLRLTAERDPVDWVRERAQDALSVIKAPKEDSLPLPKAWSTRPPAAPAVALERKPEKQIRV
jgi:hypothetical protein